MIEQALHKQLNERTDKQKIPFFFAKKWQNCHMLFIVNVIPG